MKKLILVFIFILIVPVVFGMEFTQSPLLNNDVKPYLTNESLVCSWGSTNEDYNSTKWFRAAPTSYIHQTEFDNETTIPSSSITRGLRWICEVTIHNGTSTISQNSSAAYFGPWISYSNGSIIPDNLSLTEDETQTLFINSADPTDSEVVFVLDSQSPSGICSLEDASTGEIMCTPLHSHVAGTQDPALENITPFNMFVEEKSGDIKYGTDVLFSLIPVNNQPSFVGNYSNVSILADEVWTLEIEGVDEELDYPLNFTLIGSYPATLKLNQTANQTASFYFDTVGEFPGSPGNSEVGNWTIQINLTDSLGFNSTRSSTLLEFGLQINSTNFPPYFTSNLSELPSGTQYENYSATITAFDVDEDDGLDLYITLPEDEDFRFDCTDTIFPWQSDVVNINTSNNATFMINTTLTINHVICRYVDIRVDDGDSGIEVVRNVLINISNVNDPPTLNEVGINGNMSNQTTFLWGNFVYQLNATDPDELTYDVNQSGILTYGSNDSRFPVNSDTGLVNITITNSSLIGSWEILYNVSDGEYNDSRILNLEITSNNPPILNISGANTTHYQNQTILVLFEATELDGENVTLTFDSLTDFNNSIYQISNQSFVDGGVNYVNFTINMTEANIFDANSQVGDHSLNITIFDQLGTTNDSGNAVLNFTILNTNDAPFFINPPNTKDPVTVDIGTVVTGKLKNSTIYAQDFDLLLPSEFADEELLFWVGNETSNVEDLNISIISGFKDRARVSFLPQGLGNASFLIRVTDNAGLFEEQNVSFEILGTTSDPQITQIKPHVQLVVDEYVTNFSFASKGSSDSLSPLIKVNTTTSFHSECNYAIVNQTPYHETLVFDALVSLDEINATDNYADYYWYVDGVSVSNITNATPGTDSEFIFNRNVNQTRTHNITLEILDSRQSSTSFEWLFSLNIDDRPPQACDGAFQDLEVSGTTIIPNYFSYTDHPDLGLTQRFYDPDEDINMNGRRSGSSEPTSLTYAVLNPAACTILDFGFTNDQLTLTPKQNAECTVRFTATDENDNVATSNPVTITVIDFDPPPQVTSPSPSPTPVPIPFQEEVDVPKPLNIVFPSNASLFENQTIQVPVVIENHYTEQIRGISLSAVMPNHPDIIYSFSVDYIASLDVDQSAYTLLTVQNFRAEEAPYELRVNVSVAEPEFKDSASILVAGLEQSGAGDEREVRVTFARDLLAENPECQELNDYLNEAQEMLERGEVQAAGDLINIIINGCRSLVRGEEFRIENPGLVRRAYEFSDEFSTQIITWVAVLTLITIGLYITLSVKEKLLKNN